MKRKECLIFLVYSIPWGFLAFWADQPVLFGLGMAVMGVLAWLCGREEKPKLALAGNALSALLTLLLLCWAYFCGMWQFKIFGPFGWTVFLSACTGILQWLVWKKQWRLMVLLAVLAGAFLGGVAWLLF